MLAVIIPTYNEKDNIIALISKINEVINCDIIIIDDNSPDGTADAVRNLNLNNVKLIVRNRKMGLGSAIIDGMRYALDKGYNFIATMDADLSHNPIYLKIMYDRIKEGYDLVIGSRYINGGSIENWTLSRRIISKSANLFVRLLLRTGVKDNTSNFRIYSMRAVKEAILCNTAGGYEFQICALYRIIRSNMKVSEVPIVFRNREKGSSKLKPHELIRWLFYVVKLSLSS
jgi:dolichol-phosphate mannosyltransferase